MISLYSGTPGSGKSLHCAATIYWRLRRNLPVITNIEINTDTIRNPDRYIYIPNDKLTPEGITDYCAEYWRDAGPVKEGRILVVLDEAQLLFNARTWQSNDTKGWISFFTQHRKYGVDVILIAQFDRMLDRQIRSLIEYEYIHRKVGNFGKIGTVIRILLGELFVAVKIWYPMRERVGADFYKARKKYYRLYDTFQVWAKT